MAVYLVGRDGAGPDEKPHLVEARTAKSATIHVADKTLAATVVTTRQAMEYAAQGVVLETAGETAPPPAGE